jgi:hypothetical protein
MNEWIQRLGQLCSTQQLAIPGIRDEPVEENGMNGEVVDNLRKERGWSALCCSFHSSLPSHPSAPDSGPRITKAHLPMTSLQANDG